MDKNIIEKIASTIEKLSPLFGSAIDLAWNVRKLGLFNGEAYDNGDGWEFEECYIDYPYSYAEYGWNRPRLGSKTYGNGSWGCCIGYGPHGVWLTFDKNGNIESIVPDDNSSNRCWGTDDLEERVKIVKRYLNRT